MAFGIAFRKALLLVLLASSLTTVAACGTQTQNQTRSTSLHPVAGTDEGNEMFKDHGSDRTD
ncbi:MAG: hypothetical protein ACM30I_17735 [Gemmatimonas sp.]